LIRLGSGNRRPSRMCRTARTSHRRGDDVRIRRRVARRGASRSDEDRPSAWPSGARARDVRARRSPSSCASPPFETIDPPVHAARTHRPDRPRSTAPARDCWSNGGPSAASALPTARVTLSGFDREPSAARPVRESRPPDRPDELLDRINRRFGKGAIRHATGLK
jgi:hypothetical protein